MKKRILAFLMALVMVFGMNTTYLADTESATVDNTIEVPEEVKVSINDDWMLEVEHVLAGATAVRYTFTIYKDGEWLDMMGSEVREADCTKKFNLSEKIAGEGEYHVEITATYYYGEINPGSPSTNHKTVYGKTDVKKFVMPEKRLDAPSNVKFENGKLSFNTVEDVYTYKINQYMEYEDGRKVVSTYWDFTMDDTYTYDVEAMMRGIRANVDVYFTVTAQSNDVKNVYHSEESAKVGPYVHRIEEKAATVTWDATKLGTVNVAKINDKANSLDGNLVVFKDSSESSIVYEGIFGKTNEAISRDVSYALRMRGVGTYTAEVTLYEWDPEVGKCVKYIGESALNYNPANVLAAPTNVVLSADMKTLTFDYVAGVTEYAICLETEYLGTGDVYEYAYDVITPESGKTSGTYDSSWLLDEIEWRKEMGEDVVLRIGVRALSSDIVTTATSAPTWVTAYEQKATTEEVKEKFNEALENIKDITVEDIVNNEEAKQAVKDVRSTLVNVSNDTIVTMLATDADFVAKVKYLDDLYKYIVDYKEPVSNTPLVDISKVSVVGAALNGLEGKPVQLAFNAPAKAVDIPAQYAKNAVTLDISLFVDGEAKADLDIPVTITMPIPTGVREKDLVILHYHGDSNEYQTIYPTVNADGTMTFTVTGFSTFVVTNASKPGDADPVGALFACMILSAGTAVVVMRKRRPVK